MKEAVARKLSGGCRRARFSPQTVKYESVTDDFVSTRGQNHVISEGYQWVRDDVPYRLASGAVYAIGLAFAAVYTHVCLHLHVEDCRTSSGNPRQGFVLFCNHTQPVGDALAPACAVFPKRTFVVADPSNLGIPVLGKILPLLGALPVPSTTRGMKAFKQAVSQRLREGHCVVVYPEAHVWPYYTGVRPFPSTSFSFAVDNRVPAYCMTTTYQAPRIGDKPRIVAYLDGPFWPHAATRKEAREELCEKVRACMVQRSRKSTHEYVRYERLETCADSEERGKPEGGEGASPYGRHALDERNGDDARSESEGEAA